MQYAENMQIFLQGQTVDTQEKNSNKINEWLSKYWEFLSCKEKELQKQEAVKRRGMSGRR